MVLVCNDVCSYQSSGYIRFAISFCYLRRITVGSCTTLSVYLGFFSDFCFPLLLIESSFLVCGLNLSILSIAIVNSYVGRSQCYLLLTR